MDKLLERQYLNSLEIADSRLIELQSQIKMLNEKLGYYEAKIRRLESEVRLLKTKECKYE